VAQDDTIHLDPNVPDPTITINPDTAATYDPAQDQRAAFLKVRPNVQGPTIEPAPEPSVADRIKKVVTEGIPSLSTRTVENPEYGKEQFLTPEEALTPAQRRAHPAFTGALEAAGEMTSPGNVAGMAATAGLGEGPEAAEAISKLVSLGFSASLASSVVHRYPDLKTAIDKGDTAEATRLLTHMGLDTLMAIQAGSHALSGRPEGSAFAKNPEAGVLKVGGAAEEPTNPSDIVKKAGLVYKGELMPGSDVHMFEHPNHPGKTAALPGPLDVESVKAKMNSKLNEFGVKPEEPEHITFGGIGGKEVSAPQGGHAGGGVASVEELNRPGMFVKMDRAGQISNQNKTPDFNLQKGEVGFQVMPDGTYRVAAGTPTAAQEAAIKVHAQNLYPSPQPEHLQAFAKRGQLPRQTVNLGETYGDTGRYVGGLHEEPTPNTYELSGDEEAAPTYHSDLQKVLDISGPLDTNPAKVKDGPAFITPDGKISNLPAGLQHPDLIGRATGELRAANTDTRPDFLDRTGAIRTRFFRSRMGDSLSVSVPKTGITEDQMDLLKRAVGEIGRNGNLTIERSDVSRDNQGVVKTKPFARPSDVEPMLREIGAHPDQQAKPRGGSVTPTTEAETGPQVSPNKKLQASAQKYAKAQDMPEIDHSPVKADPERATEIARIYDEAKHDPNDPRVKAAYDALKAETLAQFHHLRDDLGLKFEPQEEDPYKSAGEMMQDIKDNNRLKVFTGSSTGADHPLSEMAPGTGGQTYNTVFRWVHDAMGHAAGGHDFSENGEKSATEAHAQMYSDTARPAMRAETEGQTSWFFHNPKIVAGEVEPGEFAPQKATILPDTSADWHEKAAAKATAKDNVAGGINPRTGKSDTKGFGTEIMPEFRQPLDHAPTAQDFKNFYDAHKEIFDQYPELRVGWDNTSAVPGGHELNVAAVGPEAARVAKKLDQKSAYDIAKDDIIPTRGSGLRTEFPNYPIEERIKDLKGENQSDIAGFEHVSKNIYDNLEPDEREYLKGDKTTQRNVMMQYHKLQPSVNETTNAMQAGAALGGWWQRYIDIFHNLTAEQSESAANTIGPSHAEILKQWHAALSANKSVEDANNLAWHSYADWLDAGKPTDRNSIDEILKQNGAQPEGAEKKGNAAMSDTRDRRGKLLKEGTDTSKLFNLVNSPEMKGERPFHSDVFSDDTKRNPLMGKGEGYRKVPSMGATVAGKGNLNRLVIDTHMRDFYGQPSKGPAAQYIADSVHLRQAAKALGLQGGEGQEQLWGTVLGLKTLLKEGLTPEEASGKLSAAVINKIGKDYAEVIANDPEITQPGGLLDRLKEQYGIGRGSAGFSEAYRKTRGTRAGEGEPAGGEAAINQTELAKTAQRIRGQISDAKIKKAPTVELGEHAAEDEGDTSFNFGENANKPIPKTLKEPVDNTEDMSDPDVSFRAARHEAGHAVISEALNPGTVQSMELADTGGKTIVHAPNNKQTIGQLSQDELRDMVATSLAGGLNEPGGTTTVHASGDVKNRDKLMGTAAATPQQNLQRLATGGVSGTDPFLQMNQTMAASRARVQALLADPQVRQNIDKVAEQLNAKKKLSGDEVRAIMAPQQQ